MVTNSLLTPQQITREALRVLHQKLTFIGNINRDYDDSFAKNGAKIGSNLRIRLPDDFVVRSGPNLAAQATNENAINLTVSNQKGVDVQYSSVDLTLSLDDFSSRILDPAMARLASAIEADAISMFTSVYQVVGTPGTAPNSLRNYLDAAARLSNSLTPKDNNRSAHLSPNAQAAIVDSLKGLFQDSAAIKEQYREGLMGRTAGFDWFENTLVPMFTTGSTVTGVTVSGASQTVTNPYAAQTLNIGGVANGNTFTAGMTFTLPGVFEVHPETKQVTSRLQQFVITAPATMTGTTGSISILPGICITGGSQNVSAAPNSGVGLVFQTGSSQPWAAATTYEQELAFHRDAFTFATADMVMPKGVDMAAREVFDGISMRLVRAYDINTDSFPMRFDVLYGYACMRPQLACRVTS